jgi:hypothetical protein
MPARGRLIAQVPFIDGVARAVHEESDGRQSVNCDDGKRVYGSVGVETGSAGHAVPGCLRSGPTAM